MRLRMRRKILFSLIVLFTCSFGISLGAFAQKLNFGVIAGAGLKEDFRPFPPLFSPGGFAAPPIYQPNPNSFIVGPTLDLTLTRHLSVEVDALRRSVKHTDALYSADGSRLYLYSSTSTEWQFPLLVKYTFPVGAMNPFLEVGPSYIPGGSGSDQHGIVAGAGVDIRVRSLKLAPAVRYGRWADNQLRPALRNQIDFLVGVSQSSTSTSPSAFGQNLSIGAVVGMGLTDDFHTDVRFFQGIPASKSFSQSKSPVIGLVVEFQPRKNLAVEVNGLYRPLHLTDENLISIPEERVREGQESTVTVLTWEFPILAKYKLPVAAVKTFVEVGPSFRATGNLNGNDPSHYGITGGLGAEAHLRKLKISPTVRYTRWEADRWKCCGTIPNQVELIVGFAFWR